MGLSELEHLALSIPTFYSMAPPMTFTTTTTTNTLHFVQPVDLSPLCQRHKTPDEGPHCCKLRALTQHPCVFCVGCLWKEEKGTKWEKRWKREDERRLSMSICISRSWHRCLHAQAFRYLPDHVTLGSEVAFRVRQRSAIQHQLTPRCRLNVYDRQSFGRPSPSIFAGMRQYQCVAPNVDIILQSGHFWATPTASFREEFLTTDPTSGQPWFDIKRSDWTILNLYRISVCGHVVRRRKNQYQHMKHFVWLSTPVPVTDLMTDRRGNVLEVVPDKPGSASWRSMLGSLQMLLGTWLVIATSGGRNDPSPVKRSSEWYRTGHGICAASLHVWGIQDDPLCACGSKQTVSHIVNECPLTKFPGGLQALHSAS